MQQDLPFTAPYKRGTYAYLEWLEEQVNGLNGAHLPPPPLPQAPLQAPPQAPLQSPPQAPLQSPPQPPPQPPPQSPPQSPLSLPLPPLPPLPHALARHLLRLRDYLRFLLRYLQVRFTWVSIPGTIRHLGIRHVFTFVLFAGVILSGILIPRYRPEYETTLNPSTAANLKLDKPLVGFYAPNDTYLSKTLSPDRNSLAFSASILRSYCANVSTLFSPHIGHEYSDISRSIRFVVESGHNQTRSFVDAHQKKAEELRIIQQSARRARKASRAATSRCYPFFFFCWTRRRYEYAFPLGPDAVLDGWEPGSGTNVSIPAWVAAEANNILDLKRDLLSIASFIQSPAVPIDHSITANLTRVSARLDTISATVSTFGEMARTHKLKDQARRWGEAVFRRVPWSGAMVTYIAPGFWSWVSASDETAKAFVAHAVVGHTRAGLQNVRVALDLVARMERRGAATSEEDNLRAIGVGGQGIVEAADLVLEVTEKLLQHQQDKLYQVFQNIGLVFGVEL
ncbi:hypothetical protein GGR51DRAFT_155179 [Nemania sp. FL0031]|nr:hypothetical protein GGR51DRAFT_155179 [Nemania sp. FL0031]